MRVKAPTALLEIVIVIGDQVVVDALITQSRDEAVVKRPQRPTMPVEEVQPPVMKIPPCGHTGQTADKVVFNRVY